MSGAAAISCSQLRSCEAFRQGLRQLFGARGAQRPQHRRTRVRDRHHHPASVRRIGLPLDQLATFEGSEGRAHRLRADLLDLGERARRRRAAAIEQGEGRRLGEREFAVDLRLPKLPAQQPDAQLKRRSDLFDVRLSWRHPPNSKVLSPDLQVCLTSSRLSGWPPARAHGRLAAGSLPSGGTSASVDCRYMDKWHPLAPPGPTVEPPPAPPSSASCVRRHAAGRRPRRWLPRPR